MKLELSNKFKSLEPFSIDLPDFVVLTGINGAGKTQLLTAIDNNLIKITDDHLINIYPRKYIISQSMLPNESRVVGEQEIKKSVEELCSEYQSYIENRKISPSLKLEDFFLAGSLHAKAIIKIAEYSNKDITELNNQDISDYLLIDLHQHNHDIFSQNFSFLFKRYHEKLDNNRYKKYRTEANGEVGLSYLNDEEFEQRHGPAPWQLVNEIIREANLDYHMSQPNGDRYTPYEAKLISNITSAEIGFHDLSSGEKVLMSLALALYNANSDIEFPKVLLMDEPDASLHPSMTKSFLNVIENVFVKDKGVKVILTTHSPSTLALASEEAIFVVNKTGNRIEKVNKDKALKILTAGVPSFSIHYENRRQVFVESPNDVQFYEKIYQQLSKQLVPEISLTFISSGESRTDKNGIKMSNCDQVINITEQLRKGGSRSVFGIIDWDGKNVAKEGVIVLGNCMRYSIENYLLDPLLIGALLLREKYITKDDLKLTEQESYMDLRNFDAARLQIIVDYVVDKVALIVAANDVATVPVRLLNGLSVNISTWYLLYQGHQLEGHLLKTFPDLNKLKRGKEEVLKLAILNKVVDDLPGLLSQDFLDTFKYIQHG